MDNLLHYLDYLLQAHEQGVKMAYSVEERIRAVCNRIEEVLNLEED